MRARQFADCVTVLALDTDGRTYRRVPDEILPTIEGALAAILSNVQTELARRDKVRLAKKPKLRIVK